MKRILQFTLCFSIIVLLATACKKDSDLPPEDLGYNYFPYTPGDYRTYQVDSTYYDDFFDTVKTYQFQLKEVYESYFTDLQGRSCIRLERWVKMSDTADWLLRDVWYSYLTSSTAERLEENVRMVRLAFPVRSYTEWDGNALNDANEQIFEYDNIDDFYSVGSLAFDSTAMVIQEITSNLIEDKNQYEIYARHVGLVYKKFKDVEKDFVTGSIVAGVDYTYQLTEYGHN